jgi:integrase
MRKNTKPLRMQFTFNGHRYSVTGHTQQQLTERYNKKMKELQEGHFDSDTMVAKWAETWLETYKEGKVADSTYNDYKMYVRLMILPIPMGDVKPIHLQRIINSYAGKSTSFLKKLRITIQSVFKQAVHDQIIPSDPSSDLQLPSGTAGTNRALTEHERAVMLRTAETDRAKVLIKVMYYCGLRPSEVTRIEGRDIDAGRQRLHVRGTKTKSADRFVPIPDELLADLSGLEPFEPALKNANGRACSMRIVRGMWKKFKLHMAKELGAEVVHDTVIGIDPIAPDLKLYCLRHDYATRLQDAGVPINVARYLLGHADISTTSKIYTHTSEESIQDAAERINAHISKQERERAL